MRVILRRTDEVRRSKIPAPAGKDHNCSIAPTYRVAEILRFAQDDNASRVSMFELGGIPQRVIARASSLVLPCLRALANFLRIARRI